MRIGISLIDFEIYNEKSELVILNEIVIVLDRLIAFFLFMDTARFLRSKIYFFFETKFFFFIFFCCILTRP